MEFYSVTDGYIDYLRSVHTHVYSNKEITRKNTRKYIGVVFENNGYLKRLFPGQRMYITSINVAIQKKSWSFVLIIPIWKECMTNGNSLLLMRMVNRRYNTLLCKNIIKMNRGDLLWKS